ncbi:MBL fold metallo-hydrolase [Paracoccus aurantius]|uniref:MBL fold metallo-hydrolase n=1 Tax=Paracoccus aurantius TaxID=3073814 RepID=UPI0038FCEE62
MRLWTGQSLWILDVGCGPEATSPFRSEWLDGAHAVFITHDHVDHIGGAAYAIRAGLPIHATALTAKCLPPGANLRPLPEQGTIQIDGIAVTTGRNGHALGGIWMHFALGEGGLFYSGDWSEESEWFAFDPPPAAQTALIDASYHLDNIPQSERKAQLDQALGALDPGTQVLFPVPSSGRAGELALHLMSRGSLSLDDCCRHALREALSSGSTNERAVAIAPLLDRKFDPSARYLICESPNADSGMAGTIVPNWRDSGRLGQDGIVLFTGHMTAHARAIAAEGGRFLRWNVHPPLRDQRAMLDRLSAKRFSPLFCPTPEDYLLEGELGKKLVLGERMFL